jgi:hypothetical protein
MPFKSIKEIQDIEFYTDKMIEFNSKNCNMYMNETSDGYLSMTPVGLSSSDIKITYKDKNGLLHAIENIKGIFIEGGTYEK